MIHLFPRITRLFILAALLLLPFGQQPPYLVQADTVIFSQDAFLLGSNTQAADEFGYALAIDGDTLVVGAMNEDSSATGIDGDQNNEAAQDAGAVYVFVRAGDHWNQQAYIKASNTGAFDYFGMSVAISGDTLVVGAIGEASGARGVNGDQADNSQTRSGAAYVFVRAGSTWSQQAFLKASNGAQWADFGQSVAIDGDTIIVGAPSESSSATGVNGDQNNNSSVMSGAAYIFVRDGTAWSQQAYLKASNTAVGNHFGWDVDVSGGIAVAGATYENSASSGINGDQDQQNNPRNESGAAYVFVRDGAQWSQTTYLKASNPGLYDDFGVSVSVSGNTIVVGAFGEDGSEPGVNGDQTKKSDSTGGSGAAYVFVSENAAWRQQAYLKSLAPAQNDEFGHDVSIDENTLVAGIFGEDSRVAESGGAYVFLRDGDTWGSQALLKSNDPHMYDLLGWAVSASNGSLAIGSPFLYTGGSHQPGSLVTASSPIRDAAYIFSNGSTPAPKELFYLPFLLR